MDSSHDFYVTVVLPSSSAHASRRDLPPLVGETPRLYWIVIVLAAQSHAPEAGGIPWRRHGNVEACAVTSRSGGFALLNPKKTAPHPRPRPESLHWWDPDFLVNFYHLLGLLEVEKLKDLIGSMRRRAVVRVACCHKRLVAGAQSRLGGQCSIVLGRGNLCPVLI